MPKIAYFCSIGSIDTGTPVMTLKTAQLFAGEHQVFLVLPEEGPFAEASRQVGLEVVIIPFRRLRRFRKLIEVPQYLFSTTVAGFRFWRWLRREKIDLVHFSDLLDLPYTLPAKLTRARSLTHLRCILGNPRWKKLYRFITGRTVDLVVGVSRATLQAMFPAHSANSRLLYDPGPRPVFLQPPVPEPDLAVEGLQLIAIAKFLQVKGHANLIEVAYRLVQRNSPLHVTIIGGEELGHEAYYQHCMDLLDRYQIRDHFTLHTYLPAEAVAQEIDRAHVLVHLPNYQDPLPGVVLEGMVRARPVVAFDSGGVREEFEDGVSGFLIPQGNIDALTETLIRLARDLTTRQNAGRVAREFVLSHFSEQRYKTELQQLYLELLESS